MFFRIHTDGTQDAFPIHQLYSGPTSTPCWIIGGGPSLNTLDVSEIQASPCPKFAMNLAGSRLLRPNFWTSYDPTHRFHRSIYLDPSVIKFVHRCRAMDLVPETTYKVCDCPATLFFDRRGESSYRNFPAISGEHVIDWQDSLIQTIHIAYLLGFRTLYLAGCDMLIRPTALQIELASKKEVEYQTGELLGQFYKRCCQAGLNREDLARLATGTQYHFDENKEIEAAIQTDFHYFRVAQYLRLSRRALATAGLQLISVTPASRLNDYFSYRSVTETLDEIHLSIGNPAAEETSGKYRGLSQSKPLNIGPMKDFRPHFWESRQSTKLPSLKSSSPPKPPELPEIAVHLRENP